MDSICINRGSDKDIVLEWVGIDENGAEGPLDLTNATGLDLYEPHPALIGRVTLSFEAPRTSGRIRARITWQDDMLTGSFMGFRVRFTLDGLRLSSDHLQLKVK